MANGRSFSLHYYLIMGVKAERRYTDINDICLDICRLGYKCDDKFYCDTVLPFGCRSSPSLFDDLSKIVTDLGPASCV